MSALKTKTALSETKMSDEKNRKILALAATDRSALRAAGWTPSDLIAAGRPRIALQKIGALIERAMWDMAHPGQSEGEHL